MQTKLLIDDDVLLRVMRLARSRSVAVGQLVSDLLRRALDRDCPTTTVHGLKVLDPGPRSEVVESSTVRQLV